MFIYHPVLFLYRVNKGDDIMALNLLDVVITKKLADIESSE